MGLLPYSLMLVKVRSVAVLELTIQTTDLLPPRIQAIAAPNQFLLALASLIQTNHHRQ